MGKQLKVMIAEDEENIALAISTLVSTNLECEKITVAKDGQEAWEQLKTDNYDLILSDWNMPNKTGDELLYEVRMNEKTRDIPFIMLTARGDKDSIVTAVQAGITDYIVKPFIKDVVIEKIKNALEGRGPTDEQEESNQGSIVEEIIERFKRGEINLPVLPDISSRIEEVLKNSNSSMEEIAKIIELDPSITSKLMNISNSSYYGGSAKIMTLKAAVKRLGLQQTKNYVLMASNRGLFECSEPMFGKILEKLWEHSLAAGESARIVARQLKLPKFDNFFTMGLLHDIGKLLLINVLTEVAKKRKEIDQASVIETLNSLHGQFGAALLKKWKFPDEFQHISLHHHDISQAETITKELLVVNFSDLLVHKLGHCIEESEDIDLVNCESARLLKLDDEMISTISNEVEECVKETNNLV